MKRLMILFLLFISISFTGKASRPFLKIHVEKAGTLNEIEVEVPPCIQIGPTTFMCGLDVKITGELNEEDFRTLSKLLEGKWFSLDLSEVELIEIPSRAFMILGGTDEGYNICDAFVEEIILPSTLTTINDFAFVVCKWLKKVDLSRCTKLNYVGGGAFWECSSLSSIDFSNCTELKILGNMEQIGPFGLCTMLKNVVLPPNLEVISSQTFKSTSLEYIEFPSTLKEIGGNVFAYDLINIKMNSRNPPIISNSTFSRNTCDYGILKVPSGSLSKYKTAEYWKDFSNIEEYNPNGGDLITHTIQVSFNKEGGIVKVNGDYINNNNNLSVSDQADMELLIEPYRGYHLKQVMVGNKDMTEDVKGELLTLSSISCDQIITITFELNVFTVQVSYNDGGTVSVNDKTVTSSSLTSITALSTVKIKISPEIGYHIKSFFWFKSDMKSQLINNVYTLNSILSNYEFTVEFEKDDPADYTIKVNYNEGGIVKINDKSIGNNSFTKIQGLTDVQLSLIINTGYHLKQVMVGDTDMTEKVSNNILILPSISEDKDIKIIFDKDAPTSYTFKIQYLGLGNGDIKVDGELARNGFIKTIPVNSKIEIELLPYEGYYVSNAKFGTTDITNLLINNRYTITALSANSFLSVTFEKIPTYCLNIEMVGGSGEIEIKDRVIDHSTQVCEIKEGCTFCFKPSKYRSIKSVSLGDKDITDQIQNGSYTIESMKSNLTLKIEYVEKKYTLSIDIQGTDKIQINRKEVINGSSIIINSGYNHINISSEYYLIKQVLLDDKIVYQDRADVISYSASIEANVDCDKKLTIIAELREKREISLTLEEPGTLASHLSEEDIRMVTDLNINGEIDQRDFLVMNQMQSLYNLSLRGVTIRSYNNYPANTIPEKAFYNNKTIKMIYPPNSIEAIGKQAFLGSAISNLEGSAESYKYLTKIGEESFKDCQYLIYIPSLYNISVIEKGTFENCSNLTSVFTILPNLVEIKESAFRNCKNLSITLESGLKRIGDYALENVKYVSIPSWQNEKFELSHIGINALKGCQNDIFDFKSCPNLKELPCFEGCDKLVSISFPPNIKEVSTGTFKGCTSLQYVEMNENIERIAENAFNDKFIAQLCVPVTKTPEVYANSFNDFIYDNAKLLVPVDQLPFYQIHPVWGKFKNIEPLGTATYRLFKVTLSEGGWISLNDIYTGDNGVWSRPEILMFPTSSCMKVSISPNNGYSIESVYLNGENVTNALDENNIYVIPYLLVDSHLEVKFKQDNTTGSERINTNKRVYLSGTNQLSLSGFRIGTHVFVYDAGGRLVIQTIIRDQLEKIGLPGRGLYFIRIDNESFKIIF